MSLFVGPSEVPFYRDGVPFLEICYDLVVQALRSIARGVPCYRCPTSSLPHGPLKNADALPFYLIQRGMREILCFFLLLLLNYYIYIYDMSYYYFIMTL